MAYIRKSRAILLIISVILLHIIVISLFKYNDHPYVTQTKLNILELRKALLSYNQSRDTSDTTTFNENVEKIISSAGIQAVSRFPKEYYDIEIPNSQSFDAELAERTPDINENSDNSDEQVVMIEENEPNYFNLYDPRFTFAITFNYLSHQIAEGKSINNLPFFHWGDYVDLSQLNQFIYNPKKFPCKKFDTSTKSKIQNKKNLLKKPEEYCFDDDDISATLEQAAADNDLNIINNLKLIQSSRYSTGFHVLRSPGRQKLVSRSILSKSYLNDFMTLPFSLTFLLPNEKLFQVSIDQNILSTKQRILNTDYVKNNLINRNLNLVDELNHFLLVADSLVKDTAKVTPFKNLTHDLFVDNSQEIFNSLKESSSSLNASEKLYFTSLERSLDQSRDAVKYFEEANLVRNERNYGIGGHYDWRFFSEIINYTDLQSPVLHGLVKAWLRFTNRVGINTWIAHGSLLSWYWDALNFPWDNDIDVQMSIQDLHHLSRHYNQTIVVDFGDNPEQPRFGRYFLDCGTYISRRVRGNGANNIDARFIDMDTGAYIDITALALSDTEPPERYNDYLPKDQFQHRRTRKQVIIDSLERNKHLQAYNCRNNHFSRLVELSPLRLTVFEGERAYIAHSYEQSLLNEYGEKSLFLQTFRGYTFLPKLRNWVKVEAIKVQEQSRQSKNNSKRIAVIKDFLDQDYEKLLGYNHDVLREYYVTQQVTDYHDVEMVAL
ncbi:regulator of cell wall mannosyl phosphorylation, partial [Scheffersomyces amazonensis]|uniref:regulator of cell wall mannosyl phosphorylation n=1 Tax=Scheffersomyces amazonensis TaxID=1078765 RepID=UPI00315D6CED